MAHSSYDYQNSQRSVSNNIKIRNVKEDSVVNIKGYDLKYGSSIEYDEDDDHLIYIYDKNYTIHTELHGRITTIENDGKMTTTIDKGNGVISKTEYEKPIKSSQNGYGGRYGVSGLEYTVEMRYDNMGNLNAVVNHKVPTDDGYTIVANDSEGNVYEINRGSSIYFNSDGTVRNYENDKEI